MCCVCVVGIYSADAVLRGRISDASELLISRPTAVYTHIQRVADMYLTLPATLHNNPVGMAQPLIAHFEYVHHSLFALSRVHHKNMYVVIEKYMCVYGDGDGVCMVMAVRYAD